MELSNLVTLLKGKKQGNEYLACCPAHEDRSPSFSFSEKNGVLLFKCFVGCDQQTLFKIIKQKYEDAYGKEEKTKTITPKKQENITAYMYENEEGEQVFKVERIGYDDGSKTFRQLHKTESGLWEYGRGNVVFAPLFFRQWKSDNLVAIVEGEKCAIEARNFGIEATCVPGGVHGWKMEYAKYFEGKDVIIIPDNDEAGKGFAQTVLSSLIAKSNPVIVELPGLAHAEDIVEWISKGHTLEEFSALVKEAKSKPVIGLGFEDEFSDMSFVDEVQDGNSQKIIPFGIPFLDDAWGGILPTDLCVLTAKSGVGKTQMAMSIAKNLLDKGNKVAFFALEAFKKEIGMRMLYTVAIDMYVKRKTSFEPYASFADWVRGEPRVRLAMAPYVEEAKQIIQKKWGSKLFTHYLHKKFTIEDFEKRFPVIAKQTDLVIIDHLHYISRSPDSPGGHDFLGDVMGRMKNLVEEYRVPILLIAHVRKEDVQDRKPIPDAEDIHGSSDVFKIATKVAVIGKPLDGGYDPVAKEQTTYMKVPKDRLGEIADWMVCKMNYSIREQRYKDNYDLVKVAKQKDKTWAETPVLTKPDWFGRSSGVKQEGMFGNVF